MTGNDQSFRGTQGLPGWGNGLGETTRLRVATFVALLR